MIEGWFDGVTEPRNPGGHAAYGILIKRNGKTLMSKGVYVGSGASDQQQRRRVRGRHRYFQISPAASAREGRDLRRLKTGHHAAQWAVEGEGRVVSALLQAGSGAVRTPVLRIRLEWIPREENEECDRLSKKVLLDRGVEFRLQP